MWGHARRQTLASQEERSHQEPLCQHCGLWLSCFQARGMSVLGLSDPTVGHSVVAAQSLWQNVAYELVHMYIGRCNWLQKGWGLDSAFLIFMQIAKANFYSASITPGSQAAKDKRIMPIRCRLRHWAALDQEYSLGGCHLVLSIKLLGTKTHSFAGTSCMATVYKSRAE